MRGSLLSCALLFPLLADANPVDIQEYRGKIVVLNFWATWCVPCKTEMPLLAEIHKSYAGRAVVIGVSADDDKTIAQVRPFVESLNLPFPIRTGATTEHMEQLGLGHALPATAIFDRNGQIAFRIIGALDRKSLAKRIEYLLNGKQGKSPAAVLGHVEDEEHTHGGVGVEGASMVPS